MKSAWKKLVCTALALAVTVWGGMPALHTQAMTAAPTARHAAHDRRALLDGSRWASAPADDAFRAKALSKRQCIAGLASTDKHISKSGTYGSATYNANLYIDRGITFTLAAGAKVIVNGDLYIFGTMKIASGSLTVNGDIVVMGSMQVSGGAVTVNKSPTNPSGTQPGGSVYVQPDTAVGTLALSGTAVFTVNSPRTDCGFFLVDGLLQMFSGAPKLVVKKGTFYAAGASTAGKLLAGKLELYGNFIQRGQYAVPGGTTSSDASFAPGPAFQAVIGLNSAVKRKIQFHSPWSSYFAGLTIASGNLFDAASIISLKIRPTANVSINAGASLLMLQGDLNGTTYSATASMVSTTPRTALVVGAGRLNTYGDFALAADSVLSMQQHTGMAAVYGDFFTYSKNTQALAQGTLNVSGSFYQCISSAGHKNTFAPGAGFNTIIRGTGRTIGFESPEASWFTNLSTSGATLTANSVVSLYRTLQADTSLAYPTVYFRGSLNGRTLTLTGNAVVPGNPAATNAATNPVNTLDVAGGRLQVTGNLTVNGVLKMTNPMDKVIVGRNFNAAGLDSTSKLTAGDLVIGGSFTQSNALSGKSFRATDAHRTVFNGTVRQIVTFASGNDFVANSRFAKTVLVNATATLPAGSFDTKVSTSSLLNNLTADVGTFNPAYAAGKLSYNLVLPTGTDTVTLSAEKRYADVLMTIDGAETTQKTVTGVPYGTYIPVKIVLKAAKATGTEEYYATTTYTVDVQQLNTALKGFGLPTGAVLAPAFASGTYSYTAHVPATMPAVAINPLPLNPDSSTRIDSAAVKTKTITVPTGGTASTAVTVLGQDGATLGTAYRLNFQSHKPVTGIKVSAGTIAFQPGTAAYTVSAPSTAASVTVTVTRSTDCSRLLINGVQQTSVVLKPAAGGTAKATVQATDKDGRTVSTYTVTVKRG